MRKYIILAVVLPVCFACVHSPRDDRGDSIDFWDTTPRDSQLVFHGVAGRLSNHDEEIRLAKEDAARKVAMFLSIIGEYTRSESVGGGLFDYNFNHEGRLYYNENYKELAEDLDFDRTIDVLVTDRAVFVRVRYTPQFPFFFNYKYSTRKDKPEWIENPPRIPSFVVGIGHANPRLYHKDTVIASYENAVYAIVGNIHNEVQGGFQNRKSTEGSFRDFDAKAENILNAKAALEGFYVLEIWMDPANQDVYTLAIAKQKS